MNYWNYFDGGVAARINGGKRAECRYRVGWRRTAWMRGWWGCHRKLKQHSK